jgi:hypothetical protein
MFTESRRFFFVVSFFFMADTVSGQKYCIYQGCVHLYILDLAALTWFLLYI